MAIDLYDAAETATGGGQLGAVPLAVAGYLSTAKSHHAEHLAEWNRALEAGGLPPVTAADAGLEPTLAKMLAEAKDLNGAVGLIAVVEEILADTYLRSILTLAGQGRHHDRRADPHRRPAAPGHPELPARPLPGAGAVHGAGQGSQLARSSPNR